VQKEEKETDAELGPDRETAAGLAELLVGTTNRESKVAVRMKYLGNRNRVSKVAVRMSYLIISNEILILNQQNQFSYYYRLKFNGNDQLIQYLFTHLPWGSPASLPSVNHYLH
jgi:hypothetical protein